MPHDENDTLYRIEKHLMNLWAADRLLLQSVADLTECVEDLADCVDSDMEDDKKLRDLSTSIRKKTADLEAAIQAASPTDPPQ